MHVNISVPDLDPVSLVVSKAVGHNTERDTIQRESTVATLELADLMPSDPQECQSTHTLCTCTSDAIRTRVVQHIDGFTATVVPGIHIRPCITYTCT